MGVARNANVLAVGPGLSRGAVPAELARRLVAAAPCPIVIDADGLDALAGSAENLAHAESARVLTPHVGEMARLTGRTAGEIEARRIDIAREHAYAWKSVVVLKGAPTVTASAEGRATVNPTGNPGMATAGMGDVLTGVIAALIGQGLAPYDAARLGVFVHGMAGDRAAELLGPLGIAASDALEALPASIATLVRARDEALVKRVRGQAKRPGR
jgi:NAD(P)H-hydrate epimerase